MSKPMNTTEEERLIVEIFLYDSFTTSSFHLTIFESTVISVSDSDTVRYELGRISCKTLQSHHHVPHQYDKSILPEACMQGQYDQSNRGLFTPLIRHHHHQPTPNTSMCKLEAS